MEINYTEILVAFMALLSGIAGKISWDKWVKKDKHLTKIDDLLEDKFKLQEEIDKLLDRHDKQRREYDKKINIVYDLVTSLSEKYMAAVRENKALKDKDDSPGGV